MKTFSLMARFLGVATLALLCGPAAHAKNAQIITTENGSGIEITVSSDFDFRPFTGAVPLHISIANNSSRAGTWEIHAKLMGGMETSTTVTLDAGKSRTTSLVASLFSKYGPDRYNNFTVHVTGPGISGNGYCHFPRNSSSPNSSMGTQFLAMGRDIAARSFEPLKKQVDSATHAFEGSPFDPADLGPDWRGYAGVNWMVMSEPEWTQLAPDVRAGIQQWVGQGGHLVLFHLEGSSFRIGSGAGPVRYGFGDMRDLVWNGKELNPDVLQPLITGPSSSLITSDFPEDSGWPMFSALGKVEPNEPLIVSFVIAFALLIGPINLFYFAPSTRRHRLFYTTPLLSLGGTLLLMAVIYLQEGVGGTGRRVAVLRLLPDTHEAVVVQDQVARTSLLLGSSFHLNEEALAAPMRFGRFDLRSGDEWTVEGREYSGNWFKSRTIQAQRIASLRSTRAAITLVDTDPSGAPVIVSSIETPLETLMVTGKDGKVWAGDTVRTGEKVTLHAVKPELRDRWWKDVIQPVSTKMKNLVGSPDYNQGAELFFQAKAAQPKGVLAETLPSIRWKDDFALYLGPVTATTATESKGVQ